MVRLGAVVRARNLFRGCFRVESEHVGRKRAQGARRAKQHVVRPDSPRAAAWLGLGFGVGLVVALG